MTDPIVVGVVDNDLAQRLSDVLANAVESLDSGPLAAYSKGGSSIATVMPSGDVPGVTVIVSPEAATFRTWTSHPSRSVLVLQTERSPEKAGDGRALVELHLREAARLLGLPALGRHDLGALFDSAVARICDGAALSMASLWSASIHVDVRAAGPYGPAAAAISIDGADVDVPERTIAEIGAIPSCVRIAHAAPGGPIEISAIRGMRRYLAEDLMRLSLRDMRADPPQARLAAPEPQTTGDPS